MLLNVTLMSVSSGGVAQNVFQGGGAGDTHLTWDGEGEGGGGGKRWICHILTGISWAGACSRCASLLATLLVNSALYKIA